MTLGHYERGAQNSQIASAASGTSRVFCQQFLHWYNQEHRHSGIGLLTPAMVHFGQAQTVLTRRQAILDAA